MSFTLHTELEFKKTKQNKTKQNETKQAQHKPKPIETNTTNTFIVEYHEDPNVVKGNPIPINHAIYYSSITRQMGTTQNPNKQKYINKWCNTPPNNAHNNKPNNQILTTNKYSNKKTTKQGRQATKYHIQTFFTFDMSTNIFGIPVHKILQKIPKNHKICILYCDFIICSFLM